MKLLCAEQGQTVKVVSLKARVIMAEGRRRNQGGAEGGEGEGQMGAGADGGREWLREVQGQCAPCERGSSGGEFQQAKHRKRSVWCTGGSLQRM